MLLTVPLTINDGTSDRIFDWNYQALNVLGGVYNEPAADPMKLSQMSTLHTTSKGGKKRHMLQSSEMVDLTDPGEGDPSADSVVVNITVAHHPRHAAADVEKRVNLALAAAGVAGFTAKFMANSI